MQEHCKDRRKTVSKEYLFYIPSYRRLLSPAKNHHWNSKGQSKALPSQGALCESSKTALSAWAALGIERRNGCSFGY